MLRLYKIEMKNKNEYLGVSSDEKIVPFPNFGSVLLQHAREFPDKPAFQTSKQTITYSQLLGYCLSFNIDNDQNDIISIVAKLFKGIPFELNFNDPLEIVEKITIDGNPDIDFFDPPYVRLDDKAFTLNGEYEFSQYHVLVAAQAIGQAFKLFRDGAAFCKPEILCISDLVFGVLGPLYFGKSICFIQNETPEFFQYAWNGVIESNLRDAVMVTNEVNYHENAYHLVNIFEQALGLGDVKGRDGKTVQFLGFEVIDGQPQGHCLGRKI